MSRNRIINGRRYVLPPRRSSAGHPKPTILGAKNPAAKLTAWQVRQVRMLARKGCSYRHLGEEYGVSSSTISRAVNEQTWRHAT